MGKTYTIELDSNDLGQLLDGLNARSASWNATAEYLDGGPSHDLIIEECSDAEEAHAIAAHYDRIIATIEQQVKTQQGAE